MIFSTLQLSVQKITLFRRDSLSEKSLHGWEWKIEGAEEKFHFKPLHKRVFRFFGKTVVGTKLKGLCTGATENTDCVCHPEKQLLRAVFPGGREQCWLQIFHYLGLYTLKFYTHKS